MEPASLEIKRANVNREAQALEVTWGDAHESVYPLRALRASWAVVREQWSGEQPGPLPTDH